MKSLQEFGREILRDKETSIDYNAQKRWFESQRIEIDFFEKVGLDVEISSRMILVVPIHTLSHTPYNPASRTKEGKSLMRLMREISLRGLMYPILITQDRKVIDGNRRLAACRSLGQETIECIVSDIDRDEAFTMVNTTSIPIGGKGWLEIGLANGHLPGRLRQQYDELFCLVGSYGIKLLIDRKLGLNVLLLCKSVAALDHKYSLADVVMSVASMKLTNKVNAVLRSGASRSEKVAEIDALLINTKS